MLPRQSLPELRKYYLALFMETRPVTFKGRFIRQNVRLIADIIECTDTLDISGIALFLDFKKAFESLEWNFIIKALETFGFGAPLILSFY